MWRGIWPTYSKSDTTHWQRKLPVRSCDFESNVYSVLQKRKLYRYWEYLLFYKGVYLRCADIKKMPTVFCTKLRSTNIRSPIYHLFPFLARQIQAKSLRNSLAMLKILICFVLVILVSMFRSPENQVKLYRTQCLKSYPQIFDLSPVMWYNGNV